jgi:hypothetical protein
MVKIGINFSPTKPLFYSGANQTALCLGELFYKLGCSVTFLHSSSEKDWWDDYPLIPNTTISNVYQVGQLDWLIDIDGIISADNRKRIANKTIVFLRTFLQFAEMDASVYVNYPFTPRSMTHVHEIWCWDVLNPVESIPSIQTLFPCPIKRVPFIWSPSVVDHYSNNKHAVYDTSSNKWTIHISEKNTNSNSAILPIVAIRELSLKHIIDAHYQIHNMDNIKDNKFLKENILDTIEVSKFPVEFVSKEPFYRFLESANQIVLSHTRFSYLRLSLLNILWMGIPLVHNSPVLRDLHPVLQQMYYKGNDISEMSNVLSSFQSQPQKWYSSIEEIKNTIRDTFSIDNQLDKWKSVAPFAWENSFTYNNKVENPIQESNIEEEKKNDTSEKKEEKTELLIGFSDMWPGFNYDSNFFLDTLRHYSNEHQLLFCFKGVSYSSSISPHIVICGPYSHNWKLIPASIPKIYFSAENWPISEDPSIVLYLTSSRNEDDKHMRIPTWMTFIDWFSGKTQLPEDSQDNPIRMPLHFATTSHPIPFQDRHKFCGFVVSNPICTVRNNAFHKINEYKHVTSGGALYNNTGGPISLKYPGGG